MKRIFVEAIFLLAIISHCKCFQKQKGITSKQNFGETIETEIISIINNIKVYNENFESIVAKNETQDYDSCKELIKTLECDKINVWQSQIEELKIENFYSKENKIAFYESQKEKKIERMKSLLESTDGFNEELLEIVNELMQQQKELQEFSEKINQMYKLPKSNEFIEKQINVAKELNTEVPSIAEEELSKTNEAYNLGDQSISAQTTSNEILSSANNLEESLKSVKAAFNSRQKEVNQEKQQLKEGIIRLRALIANELDILTKNKEKMQKLEQKIKACKNKPINLEKDCEPIKVRSSKLLTELEILKQRTNDIFIGLSEIYPFKEKTKLKEEENSLDQELKALIGGQSYQEPQERSPIHHLKEQIENN